MLTVCEEYKALWNVPRNAEDKGDAVLVVLTVITIAFIILFAYIIKGYLEIQRDKRAKKTHGARAEGGGN